MNILFLTFYFEPDLCAGSFRNVSLFRELIASVSEDDNVHVITTKPNRYHSFDTSIPFYNLGRNFKVDRINIPVHKSGMLDQIKSFWVYYKKTNKIVTHNQYDVVYASSSRLFTAFLGRKIAEKKGIPLYLDIRDIFVDTINDVLGSHKILLMMLMPLLKLTEKYTFSNANHINLVSQGFKEYFSTYQKPKYSYFSNGIDDLFLSHKKDIAVPYEKRIITYAGNIGDGQGLEKIIPELAKKLGNEYEIRIIGDGGSKNKLIKELAKLSISNVILIDPVERVQLIKYYSESDFLFLHLNNYKAFEKVLPSKIFEYAAIDKPILAGVNGYAAKFIKENLSDCFIFPPCNYYLPYDFIINYIKKSVDRSDFIKKYTRTSLMKDMSQTILKYSKNK